MSDSVSAIVKPHWTEEAERVSGRWHPVWGLLGEDDNGTLYVPAWRNRPGWDGWWNRRLDLRRPTHWLPYLRSRLAGKLVWLDA